MFANNKFRMSDSNMFLPINKNKEDVNPNNVIGDDDDSGKFNNKKRQSISVLKVLY
jgi:hypothetical protein